MSDELLCSNCKGKTVIQFQGTCEKCQKVITSFSYRFCDDCAKELDQCKLCGAPLSEPSPGPKESNEYYVVLGPNENRFAATMRSGERIHIEYSEDRYSGKRYAVKSSGGGVRLLNTLEIMDDPNSWYSQYQTRLFIFECTRSGDWEIVIGEQVRAGYWGDSWSWVKPPKEDKYDITVK